MKGFLFFWGGGLLLGMHVYFLPWSKSCFCPCCRRWRSSKPLPGSVTIEEDTLKNILFEPHSVSGTASPDSKCVAEFILDEKEQFMENTNTKRLRRLKKSFLIHTFKLVLVSSFFHWKDKEKKNKNEIIDSPTKLWRSIFLFIICICYLRKGHYSSLF